MANLTYSYIQMILDSQIDIAEPTEAVAKVIWTHCDCHYKESINYTLSVTVNLGVAY